MRWAFLYRRRFIGEEADQCKAQPRFGPSALQSPQCPIAPSERISKSENPVHCEKQTNNQKTMLGEEDGDPLRFGSPVIWGPCHRYLLWHQEETALSDTHAHPALVVFTWSQKGASGVVCASQTLKEAALWGGPKCQAMADTPGSKRSFALLTTAQDQTFLSDGP